MNTATLPPTGIAGTYMFPPSSFEEGLTRLLQVISDILSQEIDEEISVFEPSFVVARLYEHHQEHKNSFPKFHLWFPKEHPYRYSCGFYRHNDDSFWGWQQISDTDWVFWIHFDDVTADDNFHLIDQGWDYSTPLVYRLGTTRLAIEESCLKMGLNLGASYSIPISELGVIDRRYICYRGRHTLSQKMRDAKMLLLSHRVFTNRLGTTVPKCVPIEFLVIDTNRSRTQVEVFSTF